MHHIGIARIQSNIIVVVCQKAVHYTWEKQWWRVYKENFLIK